MLRTSLPESAVSAFLNRNDNDASCILLYHTPVDLEKEWFRYIFTQKPFYLLQ